jgi:hypothetical protein
MLYNDKNAIFHSIFVGCGVCNKSFHWEEMIVVVKRQINQCLLPSFLRAQIQKRLNVDMQSLQRSCIELSCQIAMQVPHPTNKGFSYINLVSS